MTKVKQECKNNVLYMITSEDKNNLLLCREENCYHYTDKSNRVAITLSGAIYLAYLQKMKDYAKILSIKESIEQAIADCVRDDILANYL